VRSAPFFFGGLALTLAAGWLVFPKVLYVEQSQPFSFNHQVHKDKAGMACKDCHSFEAGGQFAGIPQVSSCAVCHAEAQGTTAAEKTLVEQYVKPNREIPWKVYARQPMNARFSHAVHAEQGKLACETCHGPHGASTSTPAYFENRITGESRNVWGPRPVRVGLKPGEGMKMSDCEDCHTQKGVTAGCLGCHR